MGKKFPGIAVAGWSFVLALSFAGGKAWGQTADTCSEEPVISGKAQISGMKTPEGCLLSISRTDNDPDSPYRSYSVSTNGIFMVYDNLGKGKNSVATGARTYFMFPRKGAPYFEKMTTDEIAVHTPAGQIIRFSPDTGRITSMTGAQFKEDPAVNGQNQGGVEITRQQGLLLDTGWQLGGAAYLNPARKSTFRDGSGKTCVLSDKDLFDYTKINGRISDATFKFATDPALAGFLAKRCPELDLSSLSQTAAGTPAAGASGTPQGPSKASGVR